MQNILSYQPNTKIKGKVIKSWIKYHTNNKTSHSREAIKMLKYLNVDDNKSYYVRKGDYQASARQFIVINA